MLIDTIIVGVVRFRVRSRADLLRNNLEIQISLEIFVKS